MLTTQLGKFEFLFNITLIFCLFLLSWQFLTTYGKQKKTSCYEINVVYKLAIYFYIQILFFYLIDITNIAIMPLGLPKLYS